MEKTRCSWCENSIEETQYHDTRWGTPSYDDRLLFKYLVLESMQAGLSWATILRKKENFIKAFDNFQIDIVANYGADKVNLLLLDKGIIRNKLKINSTVNNAKIFLEIQKEFSSFSNYIWRFVENKPILNSWQDETKVPANTSISDYITKDMKKRGFKFIGSTIIYSYMQAIGMVNDHVKACFLYQGE